MVPHVLKRHFSIERPAEVEPLNQAATFTIKEVQLFLGFDTFCNEVQVQRPCNANHHAGKRCVFFIIRHVIHEILVHLERMNRITLQVRKRTVARPEVVNRNLDAHIRKGTHNFNRLVGFAHRRIFRDFKLQVTRIQVRLRQHATDIFDHRIHRELLRREVHRHLNVLESHIDPLLRLLARHPQDERTHRHNKPRFFGNRDEFSRRNNTAFRLVPTHERFETHNLVARPDIDNRLVHQHKFLRLDSPADFEFELVKFHRLFADATAKELDSAMVDALLHIAKARVRVCKNILDAIDILIDHDGHRDANIQVLPFQRNRSFNFIMNIADKRNQVIIGIATLDVMQNNSKHVRSNAGNTIIRASHGFKAIRNRTENVIAYFDGIRGINGAEAINVQQSNRKNIVGTFRGHIDIVFQFFEEVLAVINARQSVLINKIVIITFNGLVIHQFSQGTNHADRAAGFIALDTTANHKLSILLGGIEQSQVARESPYSLQSLIQLFPENVPIAFDNTIFQRLKRIFKVRTFSGKQFCNTI